MRHTLIALLAIATFGCPDDHDPPPPAVQPLSSQAASRPANQSVPPSLDASVDSATPELAAGKRLYLTACANCHGPDGTGSMMRQALPKIGDLTSPEVHGRMSDQDIMNLIRTGRDKMPAFGEMFGEPQLKALIAYVRTLKK